MTKERGYVKVVGREGVPYYVPYFKKLRLQTFMMNFELGLDLKKFDSPEALRSIINDMKEKLHLDKYIVFVKCPDCGIEVPALDMTDKGYCYFCLLRREEKGIGFCHTCEYEGEDFKTEIKYYEKPLPNGRFWEKVYRCPRCGLLTTEDMVDEHFKKALLSKEEEARNV